MTQSIPSRDVLKTQAKRLRSDLAARGQTISHAQALETIAHQWGARDWNTLSARAKDTPQPGYHPGQRISGRYLGHPFVGQIKAADRVGSARYRLTWSLSAIVRASIILSADSGTSVTFFGRRVLLPPVRSCMSNATSARIPAFW